MGLTRCYKMTVFYIYICSFSTQFILQMYIITQTYLRFCKKTKGSHIHKKSKPEVVLQYYFRFRLFVNRTIGVVVRRR